jgi:hypothetical protein
VTHKPIYRLTEGDPTRTDGNQQVLFDAFSTKGNSGSPVFVAQQGLAPIDLSLPPLIQGTPPSQGKLTFTGYRRSFLIGINNGHHDDPDSPRVNDHAGLSRMHKLSAILNILRSNTAPHDMSVRQIQLLLPIPEDAKDRARAETAMRDPNKARLQQHTDEQARVKAAADREVAAGRPIAVLACRCR